MPSCMKCKKYFKTHADAKACHKLDNRCHECIAKNFCGNYDAKNPVSNPIAMKQKRADMIWAARRCK